MSKKRAALGAADDVFGSRVFESSTIFVTVVHNREYHAECGMPSKEGSGPLNKLLSGGDTSTR